MPKTRQTQRDSGIQTFGVGLPHLVGYYLARANHVFACATISNGLTLGKGSADRKEIAENHHG